jgi:hypothetical protein
MQSLSQLVVDDQGFINPAQLANTLHTTTQSIAAHAGISVSTISKKDRVMSVKTQQKLRDVVEIITKAAFWSGSIFQAFAWYISEPVPAFGGLTAENLVINGEADIVKAYLEQLALGGYA